MSYAQDIKNKLTDIPKLKSCCLYALIYGMVYFSRHTQGDEIVVKASNEQVGELFSRVCAQLSSKRPFKYEYESKKIAINKDFLRFFTFAEIEKSILKCPHCHEMFLRGAFLVYGTVNDPSKSYRLELLLNSEDDAKELMQYLYGIGIESLYTYRSNRHVVYLRKSESIEDIYANMGATILAFEIMNSKIEKDLINNANRVTNCDSANINKSLKASSKYIQVIKEMIESGDINKLPESLKEMASKRMQFKEYSFSELGRQFLPPISKSGVCHRLEKIMDFYNNLKKEK